MQWLSNELILTISEFVEYEERVQFISCCQNWYSLLMKSYVRKLHIREKFSPGLIERIRQLIANPVHQLTLKLDRSELGGIDSCFLEDGLRGLDCKLSQFLKILNSFRGRLRVKDLCLDSSYLTGALPEIDGSDWKDKIIDCEALSIHSAINNSRRHFLYLSTVKHLQIASALPDATILCNYSRHLHSLSLISCDIVDVSMLGSIPCLTLEYCNQIIDISSLNNNDEVTVRECERTQDYSRSFANSRKIEVSLSVSLVSILDISRWSKVEELKLSDRCRKRIFQLIGNNRLPTTVKICTLSGGFVSAIDFTVTANHALKELYLSDDTSITSLEQFGLDRVKQVTCHMMTGLQSLQGLGGSNRKVEVGLCDFITDFSPLQRVPIVTINHCPRFRDPFQLRFVQHLTLYPSFPISFSDLFPTTNNPFESLRSLTLFSRNKVGVKFDGLEQIPELQIEYDNCFRSLQMFVEEGKQLYNRRIAVKNCDRIAQLRLKSFHELHMQDQYWYSYQCHSQLWIWYRKN